MLYFIEQCLNGIQLGMLLFLLAAGLTLIFGIMDLVNLAHGSLYMIGAYFAATFAALTGSFVAGAALALVASLVFGMLVEIIAIRPLYGRDHLDHVLGTFGLLLFFNELVRLIWGPAGMTLPLPSEMLTAVQVLPGVYYPLYRLVIIGATLVVALLLYILVMRTRIGMLIRAGASNREMVGALGVNIKLLYTLIFGLGAALAGFAGLMRAPISFVQIGMGEDILILAFVVIIIGGIGSIRGALVASIIVGLIDTIGRAFLPDLVRHFVSYSAGVERRSGAVVDADLHLDGVGAGVPAGRSVSGVQQMTAFVTPRSVFVTALLVFLALVPVYCAYTGNYFLMSLFTRIVILAMASVSLNLIMGYGGMVSFGHAAYLGIGGYAVGILAKEGITSGFVQWPVALLVSGLFALGVGALSLRTRGVYFIMITLAFAQMVYYVAIGLDRYGGDDGLTIRTRSQFDGLINLDNRTVFYYFCFAVLLAITYATWRLVNSRFGMVIQGARSNDRRMRAIGFPTYRYRLVCFVIAGTDLRAGGRAARQPHRIHQPRDHALDPLRRPDRHGGAGRHGVDLRPADRRGRAAGAGGGAAGADSPRHPSVPGRGCGARGGILADRARAAVPAGGAVRARRHRRIVREETP